VSPSDIERRRLAIAEALRDVMREPASVADAHLATVTPLLPLAADPDDDLVEQRATVPPLEPAGEMSEIASDVLFGRR
jgi:hypothetical protein